MRLRGGEGAGPERGAVGKGVGEARRRGRGAKAVGEGAGEAPRWRRGMLPYCQHATAWSDFAARPAVSVIAPTVSAITSTAIRP